MFFKIVSRITDLVSVFGRIIVIGISGEIRTAAKMTSTTTAIYMMEIEIILRNQFVNA